MTNRVRQELLCVLAELSAVMPEVRFGQLIANLSTLARGLSAEGLWDLRRGTPLEWPVNRVWQVLLYYDQRGVTDARVTTGLVGP